MAKVPFDSDESLTPGHRLEKVSCDRVAADQFGDERFLRSALMAKGRTVTLIQKPRAEEEVAVDAECTAQADQDRG